MSASEEQTDPRRSIMPEFRIPEGATDREVRDILINMMLHISSSLNRLLTDKAVKIGQADLNAAAILRIEEIMTEFDKRLRVVEQKNEQKA